MYDTSEALEDPQAEHLELTASALHPAMGLFRTVRSPVSFDGQRALVVRPPPTLGEHNDEIRSRAEDINEETNDHEDKQNSPGIRGGAPPSPPLRSAAAGHCHGAAARRRADPHRQHAGADRPAVGHGAGAQARRRDLRRAAEQARRPARPAGRVDRQGRPVQARPRAHAVRAADHVRQGRPADGPVRDRRHPLGDGRGAALQQGAGAPHARRAVAREVRMQFPAWSLGSDPGNTVQQHAVRRAGRQPASRRRRWRS